MNGILDHVGDRATKTKDQFEEPRPAGVSHFDRPEQPNDAL